MKKKILSIILVVALAAGVAGCGKNDSATADTSSQEASTEVPVVVEEDIEEAQETTSSRQEQFEKDMAEYESEMEFYTALYASRKGTPFFVR